MSKKNDNVYKFAAFTAMIFCFVEMVLARLGINLEFLKLLPLANEGLSWLFPSIIAALLAYFIKPKRKA